MSEGPEATNPSPVVQYLVELLDQALDEPDRQRLRAHADAVAHTTHHGDLHRAWRCAGWAVDLAEHSGHSHLAQELKEVHQLWKDSWFGAEFGIAVRDHVGPGRDVELQWVDDAVAIARGVAKESGWAAVPWEELLTGLLAVGH